MNKNLTVYKSNDLTESAYNLSLNEQRVLLACIAQINSNEPLAITDKFELSAKNFVEWFDADEKSSYNQLIEVARSLYKCELIIDSPKKSTTKIQTRWISAIEYRDNEGVIGIWFAQPLIPHLSGFKEHFTKYQLINISDMNSIYGIRLYELLAQWQSVGKREISIEWLKSVFELTSEYERIGNFKARVIEPAIKNINDKTNFNVTHRYKKTGRNVTHIVFEFKIKAPAKKAKTVTAPKPKEAAPVDNFEYFADMRRRFGDTLPLDAIPAEIIDQLKAAGCW